MSRRLSGKVVSDIGLGTWGMGGKTSPDPRNDKKDIAAIRYALQMGINVIDTAEMYAGGHTEEIVAKAISGFDREKLFIISKAWHNHLRHDDLIMAARQSIRRLGTPYLDLYLIHWPNPSVPIRESIGAMEELLSQGLVRNIGVSNFSVEQLQEAIDSARSVQISANQIEYSYGKREPERDIIPFCEKNKVDVIAYTPIFKGKLSSFDRLKRVASKYGSTPVQIALRYVMERSFPIPKSSNKDHIAELIGSSSINLAKDDYLELSSA
ncbi:MAG: aldo/keto reductase [Thermoplasmataceae archaeon]